MERNVTDIKKLDPAVPNMDPAGSFSTKIGHTTYVVGVFFNEKTKDSYDDKAKRLIMNDLKTGNF